MSIFKSILAKVLHRDDQSATSAQSDQTSSQASSAGGGASPVANQPPSGSSQTVTQSQSPTSQPSSAGAPSSQGQSSQAASQAGQDQANQAQSAGSPQNTATTQSVDVDAVLSKMQSQHSEQLNWKTSIVDLLKLLGLDSSLAARKQLADELNYHGSKDDSAAMNIWLHKEVMRKLAENGGKLPNDITM